MKKHYHVSHSYANAPMDVEAIAYTSKRKAQHDIQCQKEYAVSVGWIKKEGNITKGYYLSHPKDNSKDEWMSVFECTKTFCYPI